MSEHKNVLICGEVAGGNITPITCELLGIGKKLAGDSGEELIALLMGNNLGDAGKEAIAFGADKVYVVDDPLLAEYNADAFAVSSLKAITDISPSILLLGQTDTGRDLAPRLAAKLDTALCTDCLDLAIDPESKLLLQTRPVYGGNAIAVMVAASTRPQMATIRPKSMSPLDRDDSRQGEIINRESGIDASAIRTKTIERVEEQTEGISLEDASVVVAGGWGVGGAENFGMVRELADLLGGAVGATRPPCEEGWVSPTLQIGQSGKIVTPDIYIAIGISGAMQHLAGCSGSKHIVAINNNPDANIFKAADYGIVGNYEDIVPAFIEKYKQL
ncbi:MAG: electron transfer flavoprotein subunit alpha/FixB family protein [Chloroflexota bacterium]|nr:electron transfer flavoprotein subunit alpha/FixB family protein [Chloroflexota bacterium]